MYEIRYRYHGGEIETIDTLDTMPEARAMLEEYIMAFNGAGQLWIHPDPETRQAEAFDREERACLRGERER